MSRIRFSGILLFLMSCSQGGSGPERYTVEGVITFGGKAVPMGTISFSPDKSNGHPGGPGVSAEIRDGKFSVDRTHGVTPGPHIVTIMGFEGNGSPDSLPGAGIGSPLFPTYEIEHTFSANKSSVKFDVPKAGK